MRISWPRTDARSRGPLQSLGVGRCVDLFDAHPVQVCHGWNTVIHTSNHDARPQVFSMTYLRAMLDLLTSGKSGIATRWAGLAGASWNCYAMLHP